MENDGLIDVRFIVLLIVVVIVSVFIYFGEQCTDFDINSL